MTPGGAYYDQLDNFESQAPGTKVEYSNIGIVLVGYLTEVISGTPFDRYCKDNIFALLGMNKTSWRLADIDHSLLAMPYNTPRGIGTGRFSYGQFGEPD